MRSSNHNLKEAFTLPPPHKCKGHVPGWLPGLACSREESNLEIQCSGHNVQLNNKATFTSEIMFLRSQTGHLKESSVWFGSLTTSQTNALEIIVKAASKMIGHSLQSLSSICKVGLPKRL